MSLCFFDIETNGFLNRVDLKLHCGVLLAEDGTDFEVYTDVKEFYLRLLHFDKIVAHNGHSFDCLVISKLLGEDPKNPTAKCKSLLLAKSIDTLLLSRVKYAHIQDIDFAQKKISPKLYGKHSLEAWGERLDCKKGDFGKVEGFEEFSSKMLEYCKRDVLVLQKLYYYLNQQPIDQRCIELEHRFQEYISLQENTGILFDVSRAKLLEKKLIQEKKSLEDELTACVPPFEDSQEFIPKVNNSKKGYKKGVPVIKKKVVPFNPNSRTQVIKYLEHLGWVPEEYTENGNPKLNEEILSSIVDEGDLPVADNFKKYFQVKKCLGQLSEGNQALLKCASIYTSRIHGQVITNGAITGRCTHHSPNLSQVPSPRAFGGKEIRSCFVPPKGYKMVGVDASGLELRMLSHYLSSYDGGEYIDAIIKGDIHEFNRQRGAIPTRSQAKTVIFALIYGAGNVKLGSIIIPEADEDAKMVEGKRLRSNLESNIAGLGELTRHVRNAFQARGHLYGIDGRFLYPRSDYKALNTLIQSAGAVYMKAVTNKLLDYIKATQVSILPSLHVHDEIQLCIEEDQVDNVKNDILACFSSAGEDLRIRCPMQGELKVGNNWFETH